MSAIPTPMSKIVCTARFKPPWPKDAWLNSPSWFSRLACPASIQL